MKDLTQLVYTTKNHDGVFTNTLVIAEHFKKRHGNVLKIVDRLLKNGGLLNSDVSSTFYEDRLKRPNKMYQVNQKAFLVIVLSFTGADADKLKGKFVDMFLQQNKQLEYWNTLRIETKTSRRMLTDAIKDHELSQRIKEGKCNDIEAQNNFIGLRVMNYTQLIYKALRIDPKQYKNTREEIEGEDLLQVEDFEARVSFLIIKSDKHNKETYQEVKHELIR